MQQQRAPTVAEIKKTRVDRENVVRVSKQLKVKLAWGRADNSATNRCSQR